MRPYYLINPSLNWLIDSQAYHYAAASVADAARATAVRLRGICDQNACTILGAVDNCGCAPATIRRRLGETFSGVLLGFCRLHSLSGRRCAGPQAPGGAAAGAASDQAGVWHGRGSGYGAARRQPASRPSEVQMLAAVPMQWTARGIQAQLSACTRGRSRMGWRARWATGC